MSDLPELILDAEGKVVVTSGGVAAEEWFLVKCADVGQYIEGRRGAAKGGEMLRTIRHLTYGSCMGEAYESAHALDPGRYTLAGKDHPAAGHNDVVYWQDFRVRRIKGRRP